MNGCVFCKGPLPQYHHTIHFKMWGYWYDACSVACIKEMIKRQPDIVFENPELLDMIGLQAKTGNIEVGSCCTILKSHHDLLKDDPEHLPTEFIKKLSQCKCKEI